MSSRPRRILPFVALAVALAMPAPARGHAERESFFPPGNGSVPTFRTTGPRLVVCREGQSLDRIRKLRDGALRRRNLALYEECLSRGFQNIQAAVNHVRRQGTRILLLPGVYRERPYSGKPKGVCADLPTDVGVLSYAEQFKCPHNQNLVGIFGDSPVDDDRVCDLPVCRLQVEGTGADPLDVILDNNWSKLNGIRADRADGIYFRNFTVQRAEFNSVYVMETDGFAIDRMLARWNDEYGFLTFVSDHGIYKDCEAYGNGDSGLYPGSAADHHGARVSIEITRCSSHHNLLGYSGTGGGSTYVHHNRFFQNSTGIVTDSFVTGHPGMPQDSSRFVNNWIEANNRDYFRYWANGTCDKPFEERGYEEGVVCPHFQAPIGVGILIAGGNSNLVARNWLYDNWRYGTMLFGVPAAFRGENDPAKQFDTSHFNRYVGNRMGWAPSGEILPNGLDFWWDEQGQGNCWKENFPAPDRSLTSDPVPLMLPECGATPPLAWLPVTPKQATLAPCASADYTAPEDVVGCDWFERPPRPE